MKLIVNHPGLSYEVMEGGKQIASGVDLSLSAFHEKATFEFTCQLCQDVDVWVEDYDGKEPEELVRQLCPKCLKAALKREADEREAEAKKKKADAKAKKEEEGK